jgi:glycosyltransferase involved in cell wall biosynthesis
MLDILIIAFGVVVLIAALNWVYAFWALTRIHKLVPVLMKEEIQPLTEWPKLTVIVPACDEEELIETAAHSLLLVDYPNIEIFLIDDRSTDSTGEIIDRLASHDERVIPMHITELEQGWLGKPHAMQQALEQATGEWILFTDADVEFSVDSLRRAIAWSVKHELDHLALVPRFRPVHWAVDSIITGFLRAIGLGMKLWRVPNPRSKAFMGVGAFNLVRREAFEKTPGLEWLKMEVTEDLGIGMMMKQSGAKCAGAIGEGLIELEWYQSVRIMAVGIEKGYASLTGGRLIPFILLIGMLIAVAYCPLIAIIFWIFGGPTWIGIAGLIGFTADVSGSLFSCYWSKRPYRSALLLPFLTPLAAWMMLRAAILGARRGGIMWRGTFYAKKDFIEGKRVKLMPW